MNNDFQLCSGCAVVIIAIGIFYYLFALAVHVH
jgi:hypothetical protein